MPLQYSLQIFSMENFLKTMQLPISLRHIYRASTYHIAYNSQLALTLKLRSTHGSTLLSDKPSFVMAPLTITLVFQRFTLKTLLSKASFHSKNSLQSPLIVKLIRTKSSTNSTSLNTLSDITHLSGKLAQRFGWVAPAYHKKEGATLYPGGCQVSLQHDRRPDERFGVLDGMWNLGSLSGKGIEVCEELIKRIIDVRCLQEVR